MRAPLTAFILLAFITTSIFGPTPCVIASEAKQSFYLPKPGALVHLSPEFNPPILKGLKVHPDNPFRFDFILDKGDSLPLVGRAREGEQQEQLKQDATRLIKYFLASLTTPEKDLWVNLSPYEKDRIVPESFGQTEMGRDLLAQDYLLKQITASLIYPEDEIGKKFWKRIYEEAEKKFHTTNIPVNTFNKVWIVPEKAVVYENAKAGTAYVVESKLKVMLEQDYLSLEKNTSQQNLSSPNVLVGDPNTTNILGSQIVREIIIPELTKEINTGKNFAQLRQVYQSLILATWYKKKIKDSILAQVYADKNKVAGVGYEKSLSSPNLPAGRQVLSVGDPQHIYQQYLTAFKKGVFSYIKEDQDPATQQPIPRKYFSGGVDFAMGTVQGMKGIRNKLDIRSDNSLLRGMKRLTGLLVVGISLFNAPQHMNGQSVDDFVKSLEQHKVKIYWYTNKADWSEFIVKQKINESAIAVTGNRKMYINAVGETNKENLILEVSHESVHAEHGNHSDKFLIQHFNKLKELIDGTKDKELIATFTFLTNHLKYRYSREGDIIGRVMEGDITGEEAIARFENILQEEKSDNLWSIFMQKLVRINFSKISEACSKIHSKQDLTQERLDELSKLLIPFRLTDHVMAGEFLAYLYTQSPELRDKRTYSVDTGVQGSINMNQFSPQMQLFYKQIQKYPVVMNFLLWHYGQYGLPIPASLSSFYDAQITQAFSSLAIEGLEELQSAQFSWDGQIKQEETKLFNQSHVVLIEILKDKKESLIKRIAAVRTLLTKKLIVQEQLTKVLSSIIEDENNIVIKDEVIRALESIGGPDEIRFLIKYLDQPDVRSLAVQALKRLDAKAAPFLIEVYGKKKDMGGIYRDDILRIISNSKSINPSSKEADKAMFAGDWETQRKTWQTDNQAMLRQGKELLLKGEVDAAIDRFIMTQEQAENDKDENVTKLSAYFLSEAKRAKNLLAQGERLTLEVFAIEPNVEGVIQLLTQGKGQTAAFMVAKKDYPYQIGVDQFQQVVNFIMRAMQERDKLYRIDQVPPTFLLDASVAEQFFSALMHDKTVVSALQPGIAQKAAEASALLRDVAPYQMTHYDEVNASIEELMGGLHATSARYAQKMFDLSKSASEADVEGSREHVNRFIRLMRAEPEEVNVEFTGTAEVRTIPGKHFLESGLREAFAKIMDDGYHSRRRIDLIEKQYLALMGMLTASININPKTLAGERVILNEAVIDMTVKAIIYQAKLRHFTPQKMLSQVQEFSAAKLGIDISPQVEVVSQKINAAMIGTGGNPQLSKTGGIDFKADKINLEVKMDSRQKHSGMTTGLDEGKGIQFNIDPAMLEQLRNAPGFVPVIINIQPMDNLPAFLGVSGGN